MWSAAADRTPIRVAALQPFATPAVQAAPASTSGFESCWFQVTRKPKWPPARPHFNPLIHATMKLYQLKQNPFTILAALAMVPLTLASAQSAALIAQQAYLKASNTGPVDQFGWFVAISGDTIMVAAPFEDSNTIGVNGNQSNN